MTEMRSKLLPYAFQSVLRFLLKKIHTLAYSKTLPIWRMELSIVLGTLRKFVADLAP
jgi:hypothetical protein